MSILDTYLRDVYSRGLRVAEHPDYGGVNNGLHMRGSQHAIGNAADLNYGAPGAPAEEKAVLLWAAELADAAGLNVIYAYHRTHPNPRTNANHKGHLHVDAGPIQAYRPPGRNDALYRKILARRPVVPERASRKPHAIGTVSKSRALLPRTKWRERLVQERLHESGHYRGKVDGKFGKISDAAVKRFQKERGLKADGVVGVHTWLELARGAGDGGKGARMKISQRISGMTSDSVIAGDSATARLRRRQVQNWAGVTADGEWGPNTINALKRKV